MTTTAVALCRTSTDRQDLGLDVQADCLTRWAALMGVEIVRTISTHVSGSNDDRQDIADALALIPGTAGALLIWRVDRLGRRLSRAVQTLEELKKRGGFLISASDGFRTDEPTGELIFGILSVFSAAEGEKIRQRCRETKARLRAESRVMGPTPFGYRRDGKHLVPDPGTHPTLLAIHALRAEGLPLRAIIRRLRLPFGPSTVQSILARPVRPDAF